MEKLAFALVTAAQKLKPYFQAHTIIVLTDKPLRRVMNGPEAVGRMALWAVELSEFDIQYRPRTAIKGQVVADFIVKFILKDDQKAKKIPQWNVYTNESSNRQARRASIVLFFPKQDKIECMVRLEFNTTNNEATYEALIARLDLARVAGAENMIIHYDSQVATNQVNGNYKCKSERKRRYLDEVKGRIRSLQIKFVQIPREENECANRLAKAALAERMLVPNQVLSFIQTSPLIDSGTNVQKVNSESN